MRVYHDELAHCGAEKTIKGILNNYWFPSLRKRVHTYIDNCLTCIMANESRNSREGELQISYTPDRPFESIHVDHFGPLIPLRLNAKYILVIVDAFSRFTWFFSCKSAGAQETIKHLAFLSDSFGNSTQFTSDRGTAFTAREFKLFVEERNISHRLVAVAAPWANGLVERVNRFLKASLRKLLEFPDEWNEKLSQVQYVVNNTFHTAIKNTPSMLLLGYAQRNHSDRRLVEFLNEYSFEL